MVICSNNNEIWWHRQAIVERALAFGIDALQFRDPGHFEAGLRQRGLL